MAIASTFPEELADACNKRTTYKIIWGCIVTFVVCAWSSVHPNIPPREGPLKSTLRRLELVFWTILVPQIFPIWAIRQRLAATEVRDLYNKRRDLPSNKAWTRKHGHFLVMGGIHIVEPPKPLASAPDGSLSNQSASETDAAREKENGSNRPAQEGRVTILTLGLLKILLIKHYDLIIEITEDDITDRAKGDALSKAILMFQSSSFIAQCLARKGLKLHVTSLELLTLAIVCLNVLTFFLCWDKPFGAQTPVRVQLKFNLTDTERAARADLHIKSYRSTILPSIIPKGYWAGILVGPIGNRCLACLRLVLTPLWAVPLIFNYALVYNVKDVLEASFFSADARCVPTFYCPFLGNDLDVFWQLLTMSAIGTVFGGIHCLGWGIHLPTNAEQLLWRAALISITTIPIGSLIITYIVIVIMHFTSISETRDDLVEKVIEMFFAVSVVFYGMARLALVGLALAQLRHLPSDAFLELAC